MDQEIIRVFFYDVRYAVVIHFSAWSAVYESEPPLKPSPLRATTRKELDYYIEVCIITKGAHIEHL